MRTTTIRKFWTMAALVAMVAWQGTAMNAQQTGDAQVPAPTVRVTTHLVLVDVVVTDKQGKSVTGLRPQDFSVQENGKAQKISVFLTPEQNQGTARAATLPPGIYSNRAEYRSPGGPITVLLLDAANTQFKDQAYARLQMLKFVHEKYKPGQHMAVFTLTDSLHVLQDFTDNPQLLYDALNRFLPVQQRFANASQASTGPVDSTPTMTSAVTAMDASASPAHTVDLGTQGGRGGGLAAISTVVTNALQGFMDVQTSYNLERRTDITFHALDELARSLGGLPGRKNVIWVTGDLPFTLNPENRTMTDTQLEETLPSLNTRRAWQHAAGDYAATARGSYAEQIREADARLSAAQIAIYPIDARGLSISTNQDAQDVMREMARDTGGRAYVNQNEINIGVDRSLQDTSTTYTLGYYAENKKWDGKYRSINVKLDRPGTELQYRRGYFAIEPAQVKGYNPGNDVAAALTGAVPATQVGFSARVLPSSTAKGKLGVDFLVDASTVSTEDVSGGKKVDVVFYVTTFSANGKMVGSQSEKVDRTFDANTYQQLLQHGMMLHVDVAPPPAASQLRLAVQDARTGLVGSVFAPVNSD